MKKLIVGAPFGNYLQWPYCTPTLGTYTREYRGGFWRRLWRVLRTVRYYRGIGAWKNKLGLPNPGIVHLNNLWLKQSIDLSDKIVSISARSTDDWQCLLCAMLAMKPLAVELNVSCPNTPGEVDRSDYAVVFNAAACCGVEAIVKLPPVNYERIVEQASYWGITSFHACNTLPTPGGGLSGKPLKMLSLAAVRYVRCRHSHVKRIIGGGGTTHLDDAQEYLDAGATNVSVASALFNPFNWRRIKRMAQTLEEQHGEQRKSVDSQGTPGSRAVAPGGAGDR